MSAYSEYERQTKEQEPRQQIRQGSTIGGLPYAPLVGTPPTPAAPLNEQIRALVGEVADAADLLADQRERAGMANRQHAESEARFAALAGQLAKLLANHRAMGDPNAPKNMLP
jgi:hypothetical protein